MWNYIKKNLIKKILSNINLLKFSKGNRFIFLYHDISETNERHHSCLYSTPISCFKEHINLFSSLFEIIPLDQIVGVKNLPKNKNYASITFDDGFFSVLKNAHPILKSYNIPYTIFINGSSVMLNQNWITNLEINKENKFYTQKLFELLKINKKETNDPLNTIIDQGIFNKSFKEGYKIDHLNEKIFLNPGDIKFLSNQGISIQNHSYDHFVFSKCDEKLVNEQILENTKLISKLTDINPKHFSIPFGKKSHYTLNNIDQINSIGHTFIYTTNPNSFEYDDIVKKNFLFPRVGLTNQTVKEIIFYINRTFFKTYNI